MLSRSTLLALALVVIGCGEGAEMPDAPDLGAATLNDLAVPPDLLPARRDPTDHPPAAEVTNHGGQPLDHAKVWTVVWPGEEALGADVDRFQSWMLRSRYWTDSLAEYGVGPGEALGVIVLPDPAPAMIDYTAFDTIIGALLPTHPADRNTVFSFVVPSTSTVVADTQVGCHDFGGYHSESQQGVVYAVNLQCAGTLGAFDQLTIVISHELAESATDAHPLTAQPGWYADAFFPSEVGDLCTGLDLTLPGALDDPDGGAPADDGGAARQYLVERVYSAERGKAGNVDPCVPAPAGPYFGAAISPASLDLQPASGTRVTATVDVEPFAYGAVGSIDWTIYSPVPGVSFKPAHGVARAGDTIPVQVTVLPSAQPGMNGILVLTRTKTANNMWFWPLTIE